MRNIFITNLSESQSVALLYDIRGDSLHIESNHGKFVVAFSSLDIENRADISNCGSLFVIYKKTTTSFRPAKK